MSGDQKQTASSLTAIEKEGDAARVALAQELARQAFKNPSLISRTKLGRLGDRGLPAFINELGKIWSKAAGSASDGSQSGSPSTSSGTAVATKVPPNITQTLPASKDSQRVAGGDRNLPAGQVAPKMPQPPRPPQDIEGWAHLRTWKLSPKAAGIGRGLIVGLFLILLGFLVPAVRPF